MDNESFWSHPNNKQLDSIAYRNSIEFKKGLENLENNDSILPITKVIILAVTLNLKKAGEISFSKRVSSYDDIEKILSNLGIYFFRDLDREKFNLKLNNDKFEGFFIIGSTPDSIDEAIENTRSRNFNSEYHQNYGESMGFPFTSVKAFLEDIKNPNQDWLLEVSDDKLSNEQKAFLFFRLSKEHWNTEVQWLDQIISGVKEYSPKIYNAVMSKYNKQRV